MAVKDRHSVHHLRIQHPFRRNHLILSRRGINESWTRESRTHEIDERYGGSVEQFGMVLFRTPQFIQRIRIGLMYTGTPTHIISLICSILGASHSSCGNSWLVSKSLDRDDWRSVFDNSVNVLIEHGTVFRDLCISKTDYFRETGSRTNAFLTETENHFFVALRSLSLSWTRDLHDALIDILCVVPRDSDIVRQLLRAGYLDSESSDTLRWRCLHYWRKFCLRKVFEGLSGPSFIYRFIRRLIRYNPLPFH